MGDIISGVSGAPSGSLTTCRSLGYTSDAKVIAALNVAAGPWDKLGLYSSVNGVTWTSIAVNLDMGTDFSVYSMSVDASDNIHIVWQDTSGVIQYKKWTWGGGGWSVGSTENAYTGSACRISQLDIDVLDSGAVMIAFAEEKIGSPYASFFRMRARAIGGGWGTVFTRNGPNSGQGWVATCSRNLGGSFGTSQTICYASKVGDHYTESIRFGSLVLNESTGAFTSDTLLGTIAANGYSYAPDAGLLFGHAANSWRYVGIHPSPNSDSAKAIGARISTSGLSYFKTGIGASDINAFNYPCAFQKTQSGNAIIFGYVQNFWAGPGYPVKITSAELLIDASGEPFYTNENFITTADESSGVQWIGAGANRNIPLNLDILLRDITHFKNYQTDAPDAVVVTTPVNGSTITTSEPQLSTYMNSAGHKTTGKWKANFQISPNSAFSSPIDLVSAPSTSVFKMNIPQIDALSQQLYYARVRGVDALTSDSENAWSPVTTFTVTHPPTASVLDPSGGHTFTYVSTLTLHWHFTDPYPNDVQTAYQIRLERVSDGSLITDTGKVFSGISSANLTLGAGDKDTLLRWKIKLWDGNDISGNYSAYSVFKASDAPVVNITTPVGTANNPIPTFNWTFSATDGRTQKKYIVQVFEAGIEVFNSGWKSSTSLVYNAPHSILVVGHSYTATVTVEDSSGLQGSDTQAFTAAWTPPAAPSFTVDA